MRKAEVLELKGGDRAELEKIVKIRTEQAQVVARAQPPAAQRPARR